MNTKNIKSTVNTNNNSPFRGLGGWNIDCLIAAIIGYYIIYLFAKYSGIGISPDSIMYASTAQNLHDHFSLITFNKTPLVFFPVFYPFFLNICIFISGGADPVTAGPVINGLLFGAVIFLSGWLTTRFRNASLVYKWLIMAAVILSPAMLQIYTYLWSETLFILEILLFFIAFRQYLQTHTTKALIIAAIIAAISCITRYAGITIAGTGGLLILIDHALNNKRKIGHLLLFGSLSVFLLIANLVLNHLSTGLSTGTREPSVTPLGENLYYFGTVIFDWAGLPAALDHWAMGFSVIIFLGLAMLLFWKVFARQLNSYESIIICFTLVYGLFIVVFASISRFERINSRLISPMFIPTLLAFTCWVPDIIKHIRLRKKWLLAAPFVIAMLAFEYTIAKIDWQRYYDQGEYGIPGYTDDDWNKSDFVIFLKSHKYIFKSDIPIFSDANEAVYIFTRLHSELLPHRFFTHTVSKFYQRKSFYLIWFNNVDATELVTLQEIQAHKQLKRLYHFKDGDIYVCEK